MTSAEQRLFLSTAAPSRAERRIAFFVVLASVLVFVVCVTFGKRMLGAKPAFVPIYETAVGLNDLLTALRTEVNPEQQRFANGPPPRSSQGWCCLSAGRSSRS